jgi:hypothetical protein
MKRRAFLSAAITGALSSVSGCGDRGGARPGKALEDPLEDDTLVDMQRIARVSTATGPSASAIRSRPARSARHPDPPST